MEKIYSMKEIPEEERPRERLVKWGPDALKNHELIAIILGKGSRKEDVLSLARRIVDDYGEKQLSFEKDVQHLVDTLNLTTIQACQIIATIELGRRFFGKARKDVFLNSPVDVYHYLKNIGKFEKEVMHGLYLDVKNKLLKDEVISIGTVTCSLVHPREVFKPALSNSAVGVIMVHNHPSGDPEPSKEDIDLTKRIKKVSEYIDIELLDHVIIGENDYRSMKTEGFL
jgi:DNA repair protein RadC